MLLASKRASDRLIGARLLAESGSASQLARLREIERVEPDSWVRHALARTLAKWQEKGIVVDPSAGWVSSPGNTDLEDVRAEAIQNVTQTLLHEIRHLLGDIALAVSSELRGDVVESRSEASINRMRDFLEVVQRLNEAAGSPRLEQFDLAGLVQETILSCGYSDETVLATRSEPVVAIGDPDLLRLALQNVIRNAVEASEATGLKVVVNCACTDSDAWVAVLDEGVGLPGSQEKAWEPGVTNKANHFGWGLPIAERAVISLGGTIKLKPRTPRGTACEIRWPIGTKDEKGAS